MWTGDESVRRGQLKYAAAIAASSVILVAGAAGCGSSSDGGGTSTAATAASSLEGPPIKLVALIDDTGPNSGGQGDSIPVLQAWEKDANASKGVAGRPVSIEIADTQGNPSKAAAAVQKAIGDPSVAGVVVFDAATESTSITTLSKAGLPVIGGVAYDPGVWGATRGNRYLDAPPLPGVYQNTTAFPATVAAYVAAAQQHDLKRMVSVNFSQVPASGQSTDLANAMAQSVGIDASSITVDASAPNFTADCLKIIQDRADYVMFTTPPTLTGRVISDCNTQGYTGAYGLVGGGVTPDSYSKVASNKLIGALQAFPWYTGSPAAERFTRAMAANDVPTETYESAPGPVAWSTMEMFRHALDAGRAKPGTPVTRRDVLAAYDQVRDETLGGMMPGPVTYTKGQVTPPSCYWLFAYENGRFSGSADATCPPKSFGAG